MIEELKKVLLTDDMKEQEMTDKIVDTLKGMGYGFYYPAYSGSHSVDIAVIKESTAARAHPFPPSPTLSPYTPTHTRTSR